MQFLLNRMKLFDSASDEVPLEIREELRRSFFYLNLNGRQSLLLFKDVYCDYVLVAKMSIIF